MRKSKFTDEQIINILKDADVAPSAIPLTCSEKLTAAGCYEQVYK